MKQLLTVVFFIATGVSAHAQDFSIFDLYEVVEGSKVEVIDPRSTNMNEALRRVHRMTPRFDDDECSHEVIGTRLTFDEVLKHLPRMIGEKTKKTRVGDRLLKSVQKSSFTAAERSCSGAAWSYDELVIVENNLRFGLELSKHYD